jgi:tetratricopeptide (TPR) repeat protein/TolB-like protein/DNA-binding winged helix-turn-helix (wHTH) protein
VRLEEPKLSQPTDGERSFQRSRCGAFVVDPGECTIAPEAGGRAHHVSGQAIATFFCLSERAGRVVSRESILECWPRDHARNDEALTHAIHELRDAFDDDPRQPRYIRTVRNRGYQLLIPITPAGAPRESAREHGARWLTFTTVNTACGLVATAVSWAVQLLLDSLDVGPWRTALIILALLAVMATAYCALILLLWKRLPDFDLPTILERALQHVQRYKWRWIVGAGACAAAPVVASYSIDEVRSDLCTLCVAVMPFAYEGADASYSYLGHGIPDELIAVLSRLAPIQALSRTVTFEPGLGDLDFAAVAKRLQVAHIVEGRVSMESQNARVTVKLIDARSGVAVWSHTYQQRLASVFKLYDLVATQVANELQVVITPDARATIVKAGSTSEDANALYLQGRDMLRRPAEGNVLEQASALFESAIQADSEFARAYGGLCEAKVAQYRTTRDNAFISPAAEACNHAAGLDSKAPEVQVALAKLHLETNDLAAAEHALSAALALNPEYYEAMVKLGDLRWAQQKIDEAEGAYRSAIGLQPGNWIAHAAYGALLLSAKGDFSGAEREFLRVVSLTPESTIALSNLGASYMYEGRLQEAVSTYERLLSLEPNGQTLSNLGLLYYYLRRYADAVHVLEKASALAPDDHRVWGNLAPAQSYSPDDSAKARETYERAVFLALERLTVDPSDADARADIATYYAALGDTQAARQSIEQALSLLPDDGSMHYFAAIVHGLLGETSEAADEVDLALRTGYPRSFIEGDARLDAVTRSSADKSEER